MRDEMIGDAMPQFLMRIFSISVLCLFNSTIFVHPLISAPASTASPSVVLSITLGYPGKPVKLNGKGFGNSEIVTIYFDTTQVGTDTTTNTGTFVITIKVPSSALPGGHIVQAFGQISKGYAQASFLVQTSWVMFGDGPFHTHFNQYENVINTTNVANLVQDWSYQTGNSIISSPAVANGLIYIGSDDHKLYALNATTGALVWSYTTGGLIRSSPLVNNGMIYIGSVDDKLYALNAITGALVWSYTTGLFIESPPSIANGVIYVGSDDGKVYALNATNGAFLWSYQTGSDIGFSSPVVGNGVVYVGSEDYRLYALNASTGALLWSYMGGDEIYASAAVSKGIVYIGSKDDKLYALNATTGAFLWSYTTGNSRASSPTVTNGVVYIGSEDNTLYALHLPGTTP